MRLKKLGVLGAVGLLAATIGVPAFAQDSKGTLKIGVDLPLSGGEVANGVPTVNGIKLAIKLANDAGGVQGYTLDSNIQDDAVAGAHDPNQGASNVNTLIADETVVGMVGPFNSSVARAEIPITNEAGLPQCSPSNTGTDLTQEGSDVYRPKNPDKRNYFRTATPDNIQGAGLAQFAYNDLGARNAYVIDDTEAFGVGVANSFSAEFERLGGKTAKRDGNDYKVNTDFTSLLTSAKSLTPDVVFFGGTQVTGGGQLRKQMGQLDMLTIPFVGPDGTTDLQPGGSDGGFITLAGVENSDGVYGSVAGLHDLPDPVTFAAAYKAEYNLDPGAYSALAYACTQLVIKALDSALAGGADATDIAALREAVRVQIFSGTAVDTVLGPLTVDPNGDSGTWLSLYKTDSTLNEGKGGWSFIRQQNFAPGAEMPAGSPAASTTP